MALGLNALSDLNSSSTLGKVATSQVRSEQSLKDERVQKDKYETSLSQDTLQLSERARALSEGREDVPEAEPVPLEDEQRFARTARNNKRLEEQARKDNTINASLQLPGESGGNTLSRIGAHRAGEDGGVPNLAELFREAASEVDSPQDLEEAQAGLAQLPSGGNDANAASAASAPEPSAELQETSRQTQERAEDANRRAEQRLEQTQDDAEESLESKQTDLNDEQGGFSEVRFFEAAGQLGRSTSAGQAIDLAA